MKQPLEANKIILPIPIPGLATNGNGKAKAIEILEDKVLKLEEQIRSLEMGDCPLGKSHDEEIKNMRDKIQKLNDHLMIFIGQRQAISWIPQLIQTGIMVAGFYILYIHGK